MELIGLTQGQITVLRLTELLERGERLPRPDKCPCEVRPSLPFLLLSSIHGDGSSHSPISPSLDLSSHEELLGGRGLLPPHLPEPHTHPQDGA